MADYVTKIRTSEGDKQIDYNALANRPSINGKVFDGNTTISASDIGAEASGSASAALASAKSYTNDAIAKEAKDRDAAIATAVESVNSTASSEAADKANAALEDAKSYTDTALENKSDKDHAHKWDEILEKPEEEVLVLKSFAVTEEATKTTVVNTYEGGSTKTIVIDFNEHGKPVKITVDGVEVSGTWAEV